MLWKTRDLHGSTTKPVTCYRREHAHGMALTLRDRVRRVSALADRDVGQDLAISRHAAIGAGRAGRRFAWSAIGETSETRLVHDCQVMGTDVLHAEAIPSVDRLKLQQ